MRREPTGRPAAPSVGLASAAGAAGDLHEHEVGDPHAGHEHAQLERPGPAGDPRAAELPELPRSVTPRRTIARYSLPRSRIRPARRHDWPRRTLRIAHAGVRAGGFGDVTIARSRSLPPGHTLAAPERKTTGRTRLLRGSAAAGPGGAGAGITVVQAVPGSSRKSFAVRLT